MNFYALMPNDQITRHREKGRHRLNNLNTMYEYYYYYYVFYDLSKKSMCVLSINVIPHDICGLYKFSVTGLKILSVNVHLCDIRESVDVISESSLPGMNGLGLESSQNVLNVLNDLGQ